MFQLFCIHQARRLQLREVETGREWVQKFMRAEFNSRGLTTRADRRVEGLFEHV